MNKSLLLTLKKPLSREGPGPSQLLSFPPAWPCSPVQAEGTQVPHKKLRCPLSLKYKNIFKPIAYHTMEQEANGIALHSKGGRVAKLNRGNI